MAPFLISLRVVCGTGRRNVTPVFRSIRHRSGNGSPSLTSTPAMKPQQSLRILSKGQHSDLPLGLLPDTFIMPTGKNLPSIVFSPKSRMSLEIQRAKQRFFDLRDKLAFRWLSKEKIRFREPKKAAIKLHHDMYTAFARSDVETLRLICGDGLLESFKKKLMRRGQLKVEWRLHKYLSPVKLVSSKAHYYAGMNTSRRQAVVRIHSLQSLTDVTTESQRSLEKANPKEVLEYIVIEKRKIGDNESPWFVWGTTNEKSNKFCDNLEMFGPSISLSLEFEFSV
ncbi:hypothetical protein EDC01DRAFT_406983 [Geopyxis carbonaria]|nr:hypothetical protein EDC01DRAFT_406983 [Geopyxis carbonaria]